MYLYNVELQSATAVEHACVGHFRGRRTQELVLARNDRIELWEIETTTGKLVEIHSENVMGKIRSLITFRLTGGSKEYVVIGSDSGAITILEYKEDRKEFEVIQQEAFGRTGFRRLVPGQYLASDPQGRALMIGAVEKQKFVYIINRDSEANLTISSPLEAHKSGSICYDVVGVDVGYENPIFATLESNYAEIDRDEMGEGLINSGKSLVYYELDLGLNHVVRQWSATVDSRANKLIAVPGGEEGPSGVLVCSEGYITYMHSNRQRGLRVPIPKRAIGAGGSKERESIIVSGVVHRMKKGSFILLQSEEGDLFKVRIEYKEGKMHEFGIKYFDTVAVANALAVFRSGFLFCGAEFGNHQLYQLENLGDEGDEVEYLAVEERDDDDDDEMNQDEEQEAEFQPRSLSSLTLVGELDSLCPFVGGMINNLAQEDTPQMYGLCGRGGGSSLKVIRHGLEVTEMAVSELPGNAKAVWTIKKRIEDEYDSYIVVSFLDATLVLLIGEEVEEVLDSGFISDTPTLGVQLLADNGMLQVTPHALRHIKADGRVNEWQPPPGREIIATTSNSRQVVIALNRGDVILFELDGDLGILSEWGEKLNIGCDVVCLAIPEIQEGRTRALVMAIGCNDQTARLVSIDPNKDLDILGTLALSDMPDSLCLSHVGHTVNELYMFVGLRNGIMQRTALDSATYEMTDTRTRFLGTKPVKLFPMMASQGRQCVLALSTRPWISYKHSGQHRLDPLSYDMLEFAAGFRSEQISEGVVAISENSLRIITVDRLDAQINTVSMPLSYTPRGFVLHSKYKKFVVIESEHGIIGNTEDFAQHYSALPPSQFGYVCNGDGCWASCIRVLDPFTGNSDHILELEDNEAAFSVALVKFYHSNSEIDDHVLVVGTGVDVTLKPRTCKAAYLRVYTFSQTEDGQLVLELLHKTQTAHVPQCLVEFQGQLLAAVGNSLIMYDLGRKQLLRKAHLGGLPTLLTRIVVAPTRHRYAYSKTSDSVKPVFSNRLVVSDVSESVHYVVYSPSAHQFFVVCDDVVPRYITALTFLDRDTVAVSDKFGTFAVLRLPDDLRKQLDRAPAANTDSSTHMALHQILINIMNKKATFQNPRRRLAAAVPSNIGGFGAVGAIQSASSSYALSFEAPYKFELIAQSSIGGSDIITHMVSLPSWPYAFKKLSDYDLSATTDFAAMSGGVDQHHDYNAIDYDYVDAKHLQHSSASASGSSQYPNGTSVAPHSTSSSTAPKAPVLIYFTLLGQIGAMIPLTNKHTDVEFFQTLEMHLRSSTSSHLFSKLGNSHITYKSRVAPVKNIIDGSLCELYSNLPLKIHRSASIFYDEHADENPYADDSSYCLKTEIASSLDRSVGDVIKKLEDIRALHIF